ncbi:uncharacterized protein [Eucyclogobius newberryi]|uniref:uncharacterized protein n=1 Tax=Eucyclogobius newberryi TaxID=166745 RepID=UPI003B5B0559
MSKGLALLEQSLLQYDEEILRARLPLDPRAMLQKRDVHTSMSPEGDRSPEIIKKEDEEIPVELPFNTVIVKNKYDAKERRDGAEGEREEEGSEEEGSEGDDSSEEESEREENEAEGPGCSSEAKGLVFSSFDSEESDEWEPPAKRTSDEDGAAEVKDQSQEVCPAGVQPSVAKQDSTLISSGSTWGGSVPPIGSFVFHNCSLKENRNTRGNEPHVERIREKESPGCSSEATVLQTTASSSSETTKPQNDTAAPSLINTDVAEVLKSPPKGKKTNTNSGGEVVKTTKHKCAECGKYFQCEAHLQRHMLIHYGLKPFECPVCDKAFRYKSSYKAHLNMHTEEKPLSCSICDKGFTQSRDLRRHMLSHTDEKNFDCQECGGKFKHKHNLIRHISVIHKAEKRYPCPMCEKAFAQKHDFMTHMRTHSGEKPFSCHICTRSFGAKGTLRTHMKVHRKRVPKDLQEALAFSAL